MYYIYVYIYIYVHVYIYIYIYIYIHIGLEDPEQDADGLRDPELRARQPQHERGIRTTVLLAMPSMLWK